jgi:ribosomal protein L7/L12
MKDELPEPPEELLAELRALLHAGNSVGAIKRYREFMGCGLKQAYDWVNLFIEQVNVESRRRDR